MQAVELFAGAGGLAIGASLAGFEHLAIVEWDKWACDTIRENQRRGHAVVAGWPDVHEGDVREFDWSRIPTDIALVAGGPPCQPFSMGGKHGAYSDARDMFPASVDVVRRLRPKAFVFENVKGLTRSSFHNYFEYIKLQLTFPELPKRRNEEWQKHYGRLQQQFSRGAAERTDMLSYRVHSHLVNAADYGIPQRRERVFIVGFRRDLETTWSIPPETHSFDELLFQQWVTGDYWERNKVAMSCRPKPPGKAAMGRLSTLRQGSILNYSPRPWKTVREALSGMPDPENGLNLLINHKYQAGAKPYPGHTGSPLDLPAKTLKAGDHGVPGGENMLVKDGGGHRYFTVRESARLQTFPDAYMFHGAWGEVMRQLGNAVPVELARHVLAGVAMQLVEAELRQMGLRTSEQVWSRMAAKAQETFRQHEH